MAEHLTGFALQYYGEYDRAAGWADAGWKIAYSLDSGMFPCSPGGAEQTMREIDTVIGHRENELTGFTLFYHPGKGWQMSIRRNGEPGWSVQFIPEEQAQSVLSMLQASGHPDGPLAVAALPASSGDPAAQLLEALRSADEARSELTAAIRARAAPMRGLR